MNLIDSHSHQPTTAPWWIRRFLLVSVLGTVCLHGVALGVLGWFVQARDEAVILRYNAYLGIDLLGVWWQLWLVPALSSFFVLCNMSLAWLLIRRGYTDMIWLLALGNWFLGGAVIVVAAALAFINV